MRARLGEVHQEQTTLFIRNIAVLALLSILTACGGGGSSSTSPPPPPPPPPTSNVAPTVDAGVDATIQLPTDTVSLDGTVTDDGLPAGAAVSTVWTVTFTSEGTYVLLLTADDTALQGSDTVQVVVEAAAPVNAAPVVDAGVDATIQLPTNTVNLDGTVTDDNLPAGASVSTAWTVQSGPAGGATFADATAVDTTVTFASAGTYVLLLTADDTELQGSDTVQVIVEAALVNSAPVVDAGADATIQLPTNTVNLDGTVTDDAAPPMSNRSRLASKSSRSARSSGIS